MNKRASAILSLTLQILFCYFFILLMKITCFIQSKTVYLQYKYEITTK